MQQEKWESCSPRAAAWPVSVSREAPSASPWPSNVGEMTRAGRTRWGGIRRSESGFFPPESSLFQAHECPGWFSRVPGLPLAPLRRRGRREQAGCEARPPGLNRSSGRPWSRTWAQRPPRLLGIPSSTRQFSCTLEGPCQTSAWQPSSLLAGSPG